MSIQDAGLLGDPPPPKKQKLCEETSENDINGSTNGFRKADVPSICQADGASTLKLRKEHIA